MELKRACIKVIRHLIPKNNAKGGDHTSLPTKQMVPTFMSVSIGLLFSLTTCTIFWASILVGIHLKMRVLFEISFGERWL